VLGKLLTALMIFGLIGIGGYLIWKPSGPAASAPEPAGPAEPPASDKEVDAKTEVPALDRAGAYVPKDGTLEIELSEYAGYAGLIAANGGLAPSENSVFFKKHGFKVKLTLSENESWSALNSGKLAASATTVDVLAVYGRQFQVVVPVQIGFSRGADGLVVRNDVKKVNQLRGKLLAASQFTEAEFFVRYLAQEAGLAVNVVSGKGARRDPDKVNLCFFPDAFVAGDAFLDELKAGGTRYAGCVTWAPKTTQVADGSGGKAHVLVTNKNLLIVADVLVVNKGFAQANPAMLAGLVDGILEGNRMVCDAQEAQLDVVARAFKWDPAKARTELAKVHLSNLPENRAFFAGTIGMAGSFGSIYQSAVYSYGTAFIPDPVDGDRFVDPKPLQAAEESGLFKDEKIAIAPIRSGGGGPVELNPLLTRDIKFLFEPNSWTLESKAPENQKNLEAIKKLLVVSPGSTILLRGHVDNALIGEFRKKGGEAFVRKMALEAMELSKKRATEIKRLLVEKDGVDPARLDVVGRGWEEPAGADPEQNRRVEVQWFTVE
jgi:NitT/TauT family transport system substrate-binding protein